jgi:hypothetical protein
LQKFTTKYESSYITNETATDQTKIHTNLKTFSEVIPAEKTLSTALKQPDPTSVKKQHSMYDIHGFLKCILFKSHASAIA